MGAIAGVARSYRCDSYRSLSSTGRTLASSMA